MLWETLKRLLGGEDQSKNLRHLASANEEPSIPAIDRELVERLAHEIVPLSPPSVARKPSIIVSLTSYPARIDDAFYTVVSLLRQSIAPDQLVLWLTTSQFPNGTSQIPERIRSLCPLGLQIRWWEEPIRSYTKLVPALQTFPEDIIVTADDDIYYPEQWLELLYDSYLRQPNAIHAHRAHRCRLDDLGNPGPYATWDKAISGGNASLLNFATGCGGVLYPPGALHPDATRSELFSEVCPTADDVWFWCMAAQNGTKTLPVKDGFRSLIYIDAAREKGLIPGTTLYEINRTENDRQVIRAFSRLDRKLLQSVYASASLYPDC